MKNPDTLSLYNNYGRRKYLTSNERKKFNFICQSKDTSVQLFLLMLSHSGARISEVINLEAAQIDFAHGIVIIESLKKRKKGIFRAVPLPEEYLDSLKIYLEQNHIDKRIWEFTRRTASRHVKSLMTEAGIVGIQACAKGLRHGFAVSAIENNIPLNLIKNWMGHSSIETTAIYLNVSGQEERNFAKRMWNTE